MWVEKRDLNRDYVDVTVPFHFLNRERFHLTISRPFPCPEEIDPKKVNSIMRPTLPTTPIWNTRLAWHLD